MYTSFLYSLFPIKNIFSLTYHVVSFVYLLSHSLFLPFHIPIPRDWNNFPASSAVCITSRRPSFQMTSSPSSLQQPFDKSNIVEPNLNAILREEKGFPSRWMVKGEISRDARPRNEKKKVFVFVCVCLRSYRSNVWPGELGGFLFLSSPRWDFTVPLS